MSSGPGPLEICRNAGRTWKLAERKNSASEVTGSVPACPRSCVGEGSSSLGTPVSDGTCCEQPFHADPPGPDYLRRIARSTRRRRRRSQRSCRTSIIENEWFPKAGGLWRVQGGALALL